MALKVLPFHKSNIQNYQFYWCKIMNKLDTRIATQTETSAEREYSSFVLSDTALAFIHLVDKINLFTHSF